MKCSLCGYQIHPDFEAHDNDGKVYHINCLNNNHNQEVTCQLCQTGFRIITKGHLDKHSISMSEYREKYGTVTSIEYNRVLQKASHSKNLQKINWDDKLEDGTSMQPNAYKNYVWSKLQDILPERTHTMFTLEFKDFEHKPSLMLDEETLQSLQVVALRELVHKLVDKTITTKSSDVSAEVCIEKLRTLLR